jgi:hypothetical protein
MLQTAVSNRRPSLNRKPVKEAITKPAKNGAAKLTLEEQVKLRWTAVAALKADLQTLNAKFNATAGDPKLTQVRRKVALESLEAALVECRTKLNRQEVDALLFGRAWGVVESKRILGERHAALSARERDLRLAQESFAATENSLRTLGLLAEWTAIQRKQFSEVVAHRITLGARIEALSVAVTQVRDECHQQMLRVESAERSCAGDASAIHQIINNHQ